MTRIHRAAAVALLLGVTVTAPVGAQVVPLTDKVTRLEGSWRLDPARGTGGICGVPVSPRIIFKVSPAEVTMEASYNRGAIKLDGTESALIDGRGARAALDAGWLAVTMTRKRNGGLANVMREVYILNGACTELTVWRTLNVIMPDGSQGKIDCGNHHAILYTRE